MSQPPPPTGTVVSGEDDEDEEPVDTESVPYADEKKTGHARSASASVRQHRSASSIDAASFRAGAKTPESPAVRELKQRSLRFQQTIADTISHKLEFMDRKLLLTSHTLDSSLSAVQDIGVNVRLGNLDLENLVGLMNSSVSILQSVKLGVVPNKARRASVR